MPISRRDFIRIGTQVAATAVASRLLVAEALAAPSDYASTFEPLDRFVEQ